MSEPDAIAYPLLEGWVLKVAGVQRERGQLVGDVMLNNGSTVYAERWTLNTTEGRTALTAEAAKAAGEHGLMKETARAVIASALLKMQEDLEALLQRQSKPSQADVIADVVITSAWKLWQDRDERSWATVPTGDHEENWRLDSKRARLVITRAAAGHDGRVPSSSTVDDTIAVLSAHALDGPMHDVYLRVAGHDEKVYVDLTNERWQVIEIDSGGWRVLDHSPVRFRRTRGMRPLPIPRSGGSIDTLREFVNVRDEEDWILFASVLVAAFCPAGPYPILVFHGEQGSAKTTTARGGRALVDPNGLPVRGEPRELRDLAIAAMNGWMVVLDNLSHVQSWLSDALCRVATGGGFGARQLYTDDEEMLFEAQRPVVLTGIEELATRGDLLDRAIVLYLPAIAEEKRRPESDFWRHFEEARPSILGALLDAVSMALRNRPTVKLPRVPRMADFALWAAAAAPALGWSQDDFLQAYEGNRTAANQLTLEASPIVEPLRALVNDAAGRTWSGTAAEMLQAVEERATAMRLAGKQLPADHAELQELKDRTVAALKRQHGWPKNAKGALDALRRLEANLRAAGVNVERSRGAGRREITISCQ